MTFSKIKVASETGVFRITLSNPEKRNAIGPVMVNEILHALANANDDDNVRAVVLTGEGKAFCAGGDFGQMTTGGDESPLAFKGDYADLLLAMMKTDKPIIARVNGAAMGGGLGLVAASTFAIAQTDAVLGTPEVNVGLFPMMIMAALARVIPRRKLLEMMLFGEKLSAEESAKIGLVNSVAAPETIDSAVSELTNKIVSKSPITLKLGLRAFADQDDMAISEALPLLRNRLGDVLATDDAREGLTAFLQKRAPQWTGK